MKAYRSASTALLISLAILSVFAGCSTAPVDLAPGITQGKASADAEADSLKNLGLLLHAKETIKSFTSLAAKGDVDGLMKLMILPEGTAEETVRANLSKDVIPFFSDFTNIPGPQVVHPATFKYLDNRDGLDFYLFAQTKSGSRKPFILGFVSDGPRALVAYLDLGHCVKGRHYACPK